MPKTLRAAVVRAAGDALRIEKVPALALAERQIRSLRCLPRRYLVQGTRHIGPVLVGALWALAGSSHAADTASYTALPLKHKGSTGTLRYYTSEPAGSVNPAITTAVLVVHGHARDARNVFDATLAAATRAGQRENTLVLAPLFQVDPGQSAQCPGTGLPAPQADELLWTCSSWLQGSAARNAAGISAFQALDLLVEQVIREHPALTRVTITGFSAGAQMVQRLIGFSERGARSVPVRYVVASPGTWLYFDPVRPRPLPSQEHKDGADCAATPMDARCVFTFAAPDIPSCPGYNRWKYGTENLPASLGTSAGAARAAYAAADVTYLLGAEDRGSGKKAAYRNLNTSCAARLQGPFRLQRGLAYAAYDQRYLAEGRHRLLEPVAQCGHNIHCLFESPAGQAALFP